MQRLTLATFPKANWPLLCNVLCQVGDQTCWACAVISFKCRIRCSGVMVIPVIMSVGVCSVPPPTFFSSAWALFKYVCGNPYCHLGKKGKPWTPWPTNTLPMELALSRCGQQQHLLPFMQWQLWVLGLGLQAEIAETDGVWVPSPSPTISSLSSALKLNKRVAKMWAGLQDSKWYICLLGLLQAVERKIEQA